MLLCMFEARSLHSGGSVCLGNLGGLCLHRGGSWRRGVPSLMSPTWEISPCFSRWQETKQSAHISIFWAELRLDGPVWVQRCLHDNSRKGGWKLLRTLGTTALKAAKGFLFSLMLPVQDFLKMQYSTITVFLRFV